MASKTSGSSKGKSSTAGSYRSAKSGRYVTEKHGKRNPSTTVKETNQEK